MINWFDMPAEGLSNGGLFEVKELEVTENGTYETKGEMYNKVTVNVPSPTGKITITENGTGINVAQYATADVNVEGGGGSSDFSTAEVIVVRGTPSPDAGAITDVPMIKNNILTVFTLDGSSTVPVISTVVLYKGRLVLDANPDTFISATGSASYDSDNEKLTILGDCTLTLSYIAFE